MRVPLQFASVKGMSIMWKRDLCCLFPSGRVNSGSNVPRGRQRTGKMSSRTHCELCQDFLTSHLRHALSASTFEPNLPLRLITDFETMRSFIFCNNKKISAIQNQDNRVGEVLRKSDHIHQHGYNSWTLKFSRDPNNPNFQKNPSLGRDHISCHPVIAVPNCDPSPVNHAGNMNMLWKKNGRKLYYVPPPPIIYSTSCLTQSTSQQRNLSFHTFFQSKWSVKKGLSQHILT